MFTEIEIKAAGVRALVDALGEVQAEKFIAFIQCEPFDYTEWQRTLWPDKSLEQIGNAAIQSRQREI